MGALWSGFPPGAHLGFEVASVTRQEQSRAPLPDRNRLLHLVTRGPESALDPCQGRSLGGRQAGQSRTCLKNALRETPPEPSLSAGSEEGGLSWETHSHQFTPGARPPRHTGSLRAAPPPSSGPRRDPGEQAGKDAEGRRPEARAGVGWGEPET